MSDHINKGFFNKKCRAFIKNPSSGRKVLSRKRLHVWKKNSHKLPNVSQRIPHSKRRILQSVKPNEHPENVRLFCQVAVITRWQYYRGGQKAGFHWTDLKPILHTHLELSIALSILEKLKKNLSTLLWPSSLGSWGFMILGLKVINGFSISRVFVTSNKPRKAEL